MNWHSAWILPARGRARQRSHGVLAVVDEAEGQRRDVSELSAQWHQGGMGTCELCGVQSGNRVLIIRTADVWRLCDDCAESVMTGDTQLGAMAAARAWLGLLTALPATTLTRARD